MARKSQPQPKPQSKPLGELEGADAQTQVEPAPARGDLTPDLPAPEEIVVGSKRVACDGVGGALGHPRVWLEMGEASFVECSYCDRRFVLRAGAEGAEDELTAPGVYEGSHGH